MDRSGAPQEGWLYIQRALENISPRVTRLNDGTVSAIGSAPPPPGTTSSDAGAAIYIAATRAGMGVTYHDGPAAINDFFRRLREGQVRPRILWISGSNAENDIDSCTTSEGQAIVRNAEVIDTFVSNGGGLLAHGTCYEWVTALLPGLLPVEGGRSGDLYMTAEGQAAFPGVTNDDINAGPWHNYFQGDFGGLQPLVRSNAVDDAAGQDAAVVLGGAAATFRIPPPPTCVNPTVVRDRRVAIPRAAGGGQAVLATRQFTDAATPFRATVRLRRSTGSVRGVTYFVNGKVVAVNRPAGQQIRVPSSTLVRGRGRNRMDAYVQLSTGQVLRVTQFFVIVRCSVPRVACTRVGAMRLRCSTRTPLGVRRVRVSAASPAGGSATGTATVSRGRYTVTLRARVTLPPGRYTYRHVGTTRRRGERMVMIRYVNVT